MGILAEGGCFAYISAPPIAARQEWGAENHPCRRLLPRPGGSEHSGSSILADSCIASRRLRIEMGKV